MRIHEKYQLLAEKYSTGRVLKTDVWNETREHLPIRADKYLEQDKDLVQEAIEMGYDAIVGDVRFMPFHQEFDTVIDLSTIDHFEDYPLALEEYARVLNDSGRLLLVVWLGNKDPEKMLNWGGLQYYFDEIQFRKDLVEYFVVKEEEVLMGNTTVKIRKNTSEAEKGGHYLKMFYGVKK